MNFRSSILFIILLFLLTISLFQCTRYSVAEDSPPFIPHSTDSISIPHKLGVSVLFSAPNNPFRPTEKFQEITKKAQLKLQESSWSNQNHLEWIRTSLDSTGYDYSLE